MSGSSSTIDRLSPEQLQARCRQREDDNAHEVYCLELFRRAIEREVDWEACWACVIDAYTSQVNFWLRTEINGLRQYEQSVLASDTFSRFFINYKPGKLHQSQHGIGSILAFLRACAKSAAQDELRHRERYRKVFVNNEDDQIFDAMSSERLQTDQPLMTSHQQPDAEANTRMIVTAAWIRIYELVRTDKERIVVELTLSEGFMPRQVWAAHPELFRDIHQVYEVKRSIFNRLEADPQLQALYKNLLDAR